MKQNKEANATTQRKEKSPVLYWATIVTLVIIVIAFVVFPVFDGMLTPKAEKEILGKYDGITVSAGPYSLYSSNMNYTYYSMQQQYGEQASMYMNYYQQNIANETIFSYGIYKLLQDKGIKISNNKVNQILRDQCGDFGLSALFLIDYTQPISSANFSASAYQTAKETNPLLVQGVRSNLAIRGSVTDFQTDMDFLSTASEKEAEFYDTLAKTTATTSYFEVTEAMIDSLLIEDYVANNLSDFTQLDLTVIQSGSKETIETILTEVSEDHLLFAERAKTNTVSTLLEAQGVLSGFSTDIQAKLVIEKEAIIETLAALQENEISDIISFGGFFYLFKANKGAIVADPAQLAEAQKEEIIAVIKNEEGNIVADFITETANTLTEAAKTSTFEAIAELNNATIEKMEEFPLNYNNGNLLPSINPLNFAQNETFLTEVFSSNPGDLLSPLTDGLITYVVKLDTKITDSEKTANGTADQMASTLLSQYVLDESRAPIYPIQFTN